MGGSSSKSSAELVSNTTVINETELNQLNKLVNKVAIDTSIENAKNCGASIVQSQTQKVGDIVVGEGGSATFGQDQEAKLDFSCLQKDEVQMDVINKMIETITNQVNDKANSEILNKLNAAVASKSSSDFQLFPFGNSSNASSDVKQTVNNYVKNKTNVNLQNVIENSTFASFKNSNIQECLGKIVQSQEIEMGNVTIGAGATFLSTQSQRATLLMECIQQANVAQRVVSDIVRFAGMDMKIVRDTKTETEMEAKAETQSEQKGLFGALGGIGASIGALFGLGALGALSPIIIGLCVLCCCCCCCILLLVVVGGGLSAFGGSSGSGDGGDGGDGNGDYEQDGGFLDTYTYPQ